MPTKGHLRILLFATARDAVGKDEIAVPFETGASLRDVIGSFFADHPRLGSPRQYRFALDGDLLEKGPANVRLVRSGELAVLPPYSGG